MKKWNRRGTARLLLAAVCTVFVCGGGCIRTVAGVLGIDPGKRTEMTVEMNLTVPMRDGVKLATDVYRPSAPGSYPVVLMRIPYGTDSGIWDELAKLFVRNGYVFVAQDTRGEFDSEGDWFPLIWEHEDGLDTVDWVMAQEWCNGDVGMFGGSYFGYTQLMAAAGNEDLDCLVPLMTTGNMHKIIFRGGALDLVSTQGWIAGERNTQYKLEGLDTRVEPQLDRGYFNLPIRDARPVDFYKMRLDPEAIAAGPEAFLLHPGDVEHIPPLDYGPYYKQVQAPSLLVAGWYDVFLSPQLDDFVRFREGGVGNADKTRIIVGPWVHGLPTSSLEKSPLVGPRLLVSEMMDWYDYWLNGVDNGAADAAPVRIFVMGENMWRDEYEWPLARTVYTDYYLHSGGGANTDKGDGWLSTEAPGDEPPDNYVYDPDDPVPTAGGCFLGAGGFKPGIQPQGNIPRRDDVLVYMTAPLEAPVEVTGPITVTLYAASSAKDTDWVAKLLDVDRMGKPRILQVGIIRARYRDGYAEPSALTPGRVYEYEIDLWATSNYFKKGHRIALWITSSDFPQFDRNTNGGGEGGPDNVVKASQTVHHEAGRASHVTLPIIPR